MLEKTLWKFSRFLKFSSVTSENSMSLYERWNCSFANFSFLTGLNRKVFKMYTIIIPYTGHCLIELCPLISNA